MLKDYQKNLRSKTYYHNPYQKLWEKNSSVRTRSIKSIDFQEKGYFFPPEKQPLVTYDEISSLGEETIQKILLLCFVKYLKDIVELEIKPINEVCNKIFHNELPIQYSEELKLNALTIIIDEYYHVYNAQSILYQLEKGFPYINDYHYPLSDAYSALVNIKNELDPKFRDAFQVIAVSTFETTIVKELIEFFNSEKLHPSVKEYVGDHVNDEAKHFNFFFQLMSYSWSLYDPETKAVIASKLIDFIIQYFSIDSWREFSATILAKTALAPEVAKQIIDELFNNFNVTMDIPIVKSVLMTLKKAGIADDIHFQLSLKNHGWIVPEC